MDDANAAESDEQGNYSDIDLNAPYSDDDFENIPIDEKRFWEYLTKLEENSLFEMNLLQEMQQNLETEEKKSRDNIVRKRAEITELDNNITALEDLKSGRNAHLTYYQGMLSSNNARGGAGNVSKSSKGAGRSTTLSKSTAVAKRGQLKANE
jgi:hypothetical protein